MKKALLSMFALLMLVGSLGSAEGQYRRPYHRHRHRVCYYRHGRRFCHYR